jgi:hypothetical protein
LKNSGRIQTKKAAFGVSTPKTAGRNIILFVSVLFPPLILAQKVWERKLLWDFFIFSGLEGLTPRPSACQNPPPVYPADHVQKCRAERNTLPGDNKKSAQAIRPRRSAILIKNGASRQK